MTIRWSPAHRPGRPLKGALLLGSLLLTSQAAAQDLSAYRTLARSLDQAARVVSKDRVVARNSLDTANAALATLLPTLPGGLQGQTARSLQSTVAQAQSALVRTPAEVQANVLLARGVMRRLLYDQVVGSLRPVADPANDTSALRLLALELGFSKSSTDTLRAKASAGQSEWVGWRVRKVAGSKVAAALGKVDPAGNQTSNYLNLTRANSWFSLVHEAGRSATPPLTVAQFQQALQQVTAGDSNALSTELDGMKASVADLNRRLAVRPTTSASAGTGTPAAPRPAETPDSTETQPPSQETETASPPQGQSLDAAYAALARAQNASGHGNPARAREELGQALSSLGLAPANVQATPAFAQVQRDLQVLQYQPSLRPDAVQAMTALLGAAEDQAAGRAIVGSDGFSAAVARSTGGWVRVFLALALAALAFLPLYLLNLAFGGSNIYWRTISAGLLLLVVPLLLEGFFGLIGWLGDLLSVPLLRGAVNLTLNQGAGGLLIQGLLSAAGLGLLAYGFQGLCQQFGLLGRRVNNSASTYRPTRYTQTGLDWEEEL